MGIAGNTGLGNPNSVILDNTGRLTKEIKGFMLDAFKLFKLLEDGCDYRIVEGQIIIGREPAYQYEELCIISLARDKGLSYLQTGKAFGDYGSGIRARYKFYKDYKRKSKFTQLIDKWHPIVYEKTTPTV